MEKKYIVRKVSGFVPSVDYNVINNEFETTEFTGTLADCLAWIELTEKGYL
jgi:hypothetical protein